MNVSVQLSEIWARSWILGVIDINAKKKTITLLYESSLTFEKVKNELRRIGYPVKNYQSWEASRFTLNNGQNIELSERQQGMMPKEISR